MKVEVTLTSDEYAALSTAPGRSAPQRLRWLIRFWAATKAEHDKRTEPPLKERNYREEDTEQPRAVVP